MRKKKINLHEVLLRCKEVYKKNPLLFPFESIIYQLQYLIDLDEGRTKDLSLLKNIKIGWIAIRELDGYDDQELINLLCTISREAEEKLMKKGVDLDIK